MPHIELLKEKIRTSPDIPEPAIREFLCDLLDRTEGLTKPVLFISRSNDRRSIYKDIFYAVKNMYSENKTTRLDNFLATNRIPFHMESFENGSSGTLGFAGFGVWMTPDPGAKRPGWPSNLANVLVLGPDLKPVQGLSAASKKIDLEPQPL